MASGLRIEDGDFLQGAKFGALYEGIAGNGVISGYEAGQSGTGALTIGVSGGSGIIGQSVKANTSGIWFLTHDSADATYPRYDLIAGSSDGTPFIQKGTAGSIPTIPQGINGTIPLAAVYVGSQVTTLLNGDINDNRGFLSSPKLESFYSMNSDDQNMAGLIYEAGKQYPNVYTGIDGELLDNMDSTTGWSASSDGALASGAVEIIDGDGTIALKKTGTTETFVTMDKTVTSRDFSDAEDTFCVGLYIKDSTTMDKLTTTEAVILRFGSDSNNYYEWLIDKSRLVVGRQHLCTNLIANATSTVGTPDTANMDYALVGVNTNNASDSWSGTDNLVWDNAHVENGTIMSFTNQIGGDIELTYEVLIDGSEASVSWAQAGFILDNKVISVTKRATVISPNSVDVGAQAKEVSCKAYLSGVSEGTHYLKLAFSTNDGGGFLPYPQQNADSPNDFVNYASARELITNLI